MHVHVPCIPHITPKNSKEQYGKNEAFNNNLFLYILKFQFLHCHSERMEYINTGTPSLIVKIILLLRFLVHLAKMPKKLLCVVIS